jgi:O-acetyl-ADP-ribose deacetylase (regulator of RNase III)
MSYKISCKEGNLLNETDVTFAVNASNTNMLLGSGVSMAFKRVCGIALQVEMFEKLRVLEREIEQGDIIKTSAVNAKNISYILHVAVINYNKQSQIKEKNPSLKIIEKSLFLIEKEIKEVTSNPLQQPIKLLLPLLGCGVGGVNKEHLISLYKEFFSRKLELDCNVVIYGYTKEDYELLIKHFEDNKT